jgi:selenocysteine lyase/cysteine desulfurase
VLVDSTQAVGALGTDFGKEDVDYVSFAPYKYLMGPAGLAFLYVQSENIPELVPDRIGWKNQIWEGDHAEEPIDQNTAEKFEYGTIHFQGAYALEKSLEYLNRMGMDAVERRVLELSDYLWGKLSELGKEMYTPPDTESPIVSFYQYNAVKLAVKLMKDRVKVTGREAHGDHIRVSSHFYNTKGDIDLFIEKLLKMVGRN